MTNDNTPRSIGSILQWLWHTSQGLRTKAAVNVVLGIARVAVDFALIWATKLAIDAATGQSNHSLRTACTILVLLAAGRVLLGFANKWTNVLLGVRCQNLMQMRTFSRLMHSVWTGMEQFHSGDTMNRLMHDATKVTSVITDTMPAAVCVTIRLAIAFIYLAHFDSRLSLLVLAVSPIFMLAGRVYIRKMRRLTHNIRNNESRIQGLLQESLQNRMVLKTLEQSDGMVSQLGQEQDSLFHKIRHRTLYSTFNGLCLNIGFATVYMLTFIWGIYRLDAGTITYGTMLAFVQLVGQIQGPFREMTLFVPEIINALTSSERLLQLEEIPLEQEGESTAFAHGAGVRFTNVSYNYADGHRNILKDFSHDFTPGSTTAILGETGAGKTTLIRLILALLKPISGSVELYDSSTHVPASSATRCNLVYVPQGNSLLCGTIRHNLLLGNPNATEAEMHEALHTACADFVFSLPNTLDTMCGESGSGLSEGQAQRIAIARALLRRGSILLLDEATSALDAQTEHKLIQNISALANKHHHTVLFITHRPSVLECCENTLRLEREQG